MPGSPRQVRACAGRGIRCTIHGSLHQIHAAPGNTPIMTICRLGLSIFVLLASIVCFAAPPDETHQAANGLANSVRNGPAMSPLRELTDGFGGRVTGSPAYERSAEWAAEKFRSYGIKDVRLEPF